MKMSTRKAHSTAPRRAVRLHASLDWTPCARSEAARPGDQDEKERARLSAVFEDP